MSIASKVFPIRANETKGADRAPIDEITLFGSRRLMRASDGRSWYIVSDSEPARLVADDVAMIINATLKAAGGQ